MRPYISPTIVALAVTALALVFTQSGNEPCTQENLCQVDSTHRRLAPDDQDSWLTKLRASPFIAEQLTIFQENFEQQLTHEQRATTSEMDPATAGTERNSAKARGERYQKLVQRYGQENGCPFFLLSECKTEQKSGTTEATPCLFNRAEHPALRRAFEERLKGQFTALLAANSKRAVRYVGFGSGGMLQDFIVLVKALTEHPAATIMVDIIDPGLIFFTTGRALLRQPNYVQEHDASDLSPALDSFVNNVIENGGAEGGIIEREELVPLIIRRYHQKEEAAKQFLTSLRQFFPAAHISLTLYDHTQDYLRQLSPTSLPDIIAAADIEDPASLAHHSTDNYRGLIDQAFRLNPGVYNTLLSRDDRGSLKTYALAVQLVIFSEAIVRETIPTQAENPLDNKE